MSNLDALLGALAERAGTLVKAQPATEAPKPTTTPAEAPEAAAAAEKKPEAEAEKKAEAGEAEGDFGKSFVVRDADGNEHNAIDGFALIKALQDDIEELRALVTERAEAMAKAAPAFDADAMQKSITDGIAGVTTQAETMAKALTIAVDALTEARGELAALNERTAAQDKAMAAQGDLVKSLAAKVEEYGAAGRGRQSVVNVQERTSPLAKAAPAATIGDIFAKAQVLNREGKLNGLDVARITAHVNSGQGVPADYAHLFAPAN